MNTSPSEHWQRHDVRGQAPAGDIRHIGPAFGAVAIRQSAAPRVQPKLTVSTPNDSAELEADRVADQIMQMPAEEVGIQRACAACQEEEKTMARAVAAERLLRAEDEDELMRAEDEDELMRMEDEDELMRMEDEDELMRAEDEDELMRAEDEDELMRMEDEDELTRMEDEDELMREPLDSVGLVARASARSDEPPEVTSGLESRIQNVHQSGAPLSKDTRDFFEPRLGADLGQVRVHTGSEAASVARQLNARAFTLGSNVTFGAGQYQPSTNDGKRLIAHELTHVVQQGGAAPKDTE